MQIFEIMLGEQPPIGATQPAVGHGTTTKSLEKTTATAEPDFSGIPERPSEEHVIATALAAIRAEERNQRVPDAVLKAMVGGAGTPHVTRAILAKMTGKSAATVANFLNKRMGVIVQ